VKPLRKLTLPGPPSPSLKNKYEVQWKPIFSYLEESGAYEVPRNTIQMMDGEIKRIYDQCVNFLSTMSRDGSRVDDRPPQIGDL
jgi:hypothetical protein